MRHTTARPQRVAILATAAALMFALAACDPGNPDPPPTSSTSSEAHTTEPSTPATTEPSATYKDEQIASAQAFVESFFAQATAVQNDGYDDWESLRDYFLGDPDLWSASIEPVWSALASRGGSTTGMFVVVSAEATAWEEDPTGDGFDSVSFDVCLDTSDMVDLDENGDEREVQPQDQAYLATVTVMGQPDSELGWSFTEYEEDLDATC